MAIAAIGNGMTKVVSCFMTNVQSLNGVTFPHSKSYCVQHMTQTARIRMAMVVSRFTTGVHSPNGVTRNRSSGILFGKILAHHTFDKNYYQDYNWYQDNYQLGDI